MRKYIELAEQSIHLTESEMTEAGRQMFDPETPQDEIQRFLLALKEKGETSDEISGLVAAVKEIAGTYETTAENIIDNCGTGGDGSQSFNISTCAAFVIAGAGVPVAKHGNRSISSKTGSADVLEHLGVRLDFTRDEMKEMLEKHQITFLFAPHVHSGIKNVMKARKALGVPTIFNLIGPLTNPVNLSSQLIGIYRRDMIHTMALAMKKTGRKRGIVLNGAGHMDEASLAGTNYLALLEEDNIKEFTLHPEELGLSVVPNEEIKGGDSKQNAKILLSVLSGEDSVFRQTVVLNAGIALYASGQVGSIKEGVRKAEESIDSKSALKKLNQLIDFSKKKAVV
ncbi:anthranilate phosphoribosyltransferase [Jeotgalibacillus haloalkalitolerans]|uniref:Anthranilate phosphoribosyltransferase n=1 Tax=Jeotgalibacillus haloalkalitolerans TaxID=3104292 RepID=A0ABU5KLS1_9BACL|nr:anthranilate phosphoribosyltransferase [Jeotgalibacillus sp. HH7-29]MDZ5711911.1 anthranilate phosphoribosyltransferase [Jeotgalibacillus sp. HH7-29]